MAIVKLEDKHKSNFDIKLTPERHYVSSSSGITGSVYVFPNRSNTQKDNIDERLNLAPMVDSGTEFSGTPIRAYDSNSLEARREEIYAGDFGKMIGGLFSDAVSYEYYLSHPKEFSIQNAGSGYTDGSYTSQTTTSNGDGTGILVDVTVSGGSITAVTRSATPYNSGQSSDGKYLVNDSIVINTANIGTGNGALSVVVNTVVSEYDYPSTSGPTVMDPAPQTVTAGTINGTTFPVNAVVYRQTDLTSFTWTSNGNWSENGGSSIIIHNTLPENDRDQSGINYEVALGMLLDGANPYTEDHAWRYGLDPLDSSSWPTGITVDNDSKISTTGGGVLTGRVVEYDDAGIPVQGDPISGSIEVNPWPPEIAKHGTSVITNFMVQGYSDLSMHPRNKTKKEIKLYRANHDQFSSGSLQQKILARKLSDSIIPDTGWWYRNYQCLSLGKHTYNSTDYFPALVYDNFTDSNAYSIQPTDAFMIEFWIKPTKEQTAAGTIMHVIKNHAVTIQPSVTVNGIPQEWKLYFHWGNTNAAYNATPSSNYNYKSTTSLKLDTWHHVIFRYSQDFNNGDFMLFVDGVSDKNMYTLSGTEYNAANADALTWSNGDTITRNADGVVFTKTASGWNDAIGTGYNNLPTAGIDGGEASRSPKGFLHQNTSTIAHGNALIIGGWWGRSSYSQQKNLFDEPAYHQGMDKTFIHGTNYLSTSLSYAEAATLKFQLKSEVHEIRCWNVVKSQYDIALDKSTSLTSTEFQDCKYYIPFLFDPREDTPIWRKPVMVPDTNATSEDGYYKDGSISSIQVRWAIQAGGAGDVPEVAPFCVNSAYIAGMPSINVHAHLREYKRGKYPVVIGYPDRTDVTNTTVYPTPVDTNDTIALNKIKYFIDHWQTLPWLRSINSLLLPCDNHNFYPKFEIVSSNAHVYKNQKDLIRMEGSGIGLMDNPFQIKYMMYDEQYNIADAIDTLDPSDQTSATTQVQNASGDDVNQFTDADFASPLSIIISIPQIYYGTRIHEKSVELRFKNNPEGKEIKIVDYNGLLYRCDNASGIPAGKVGQIDYAQGALVIFHPMLTSLGIDNFDIKFKGEKNLHVMQLDIPCPVGTANLSSNPSYKSLKPSSNKNESRSGFTYITTIYLHDENLNVIGKANLAQPIVKREEDSFLFRLKVDF